MNWKVRCCVTIAVLGVLAATAGCSVNGGGWFSSLLMQGGQPIPAARRRRGDQ
jgi:hypothetical protein